MIFEFWQEIHKEEGNITNDNNSKILLLLPPPPPANRA